MKKLLLGIFLLITSNTSFAIALDEQVVRIPRQGVIFEHTLEATLYKPPGDGPFPVVIVNHGIMGDRAYFQQPRWKALANAPYFVSRGYVVLVPMRSGFANSGGAISPSSCGEEPVGNIHAEDIRYAIDYAHTLPYVDKTKTILLGLSTGGLATVAYGAGKSIDPSVIGLLNFAGGHFQFWCGDWKSDLIATMGRFGKTNKIPSLWFYGSNDHYWPEELSDAMFKAYVQGGGNAKLIKYGLFKDDAHKLVNDVDGNPIWNPPVSEFLDSLGLNSKVLYP